MDTEYLVMGTAMDMVTDTDTPACVSWASELSERP